MKRNYVGFLLVCAVLAMLAGAVVVQNAQAQETCKSDQLFSVRFGQKGEAVSNVQRCLTDLGYKIQAGITGFFGTQTTGALKSFYERLTGLKVTGRIFGITGIQAVKNIFTAQKESLTLNQRGSLYKRVSSAEELADYFERARQGYGYGTFGSLGISTGMERAMIASGAPGAMSGAAPMMAADAGVAQEAGRVSETNVQVKGIDEPDIVKTDGKNIYISGRQQYWIEPMPMQIMEQSISIAPGEPVPPYRRYAPSTAAIKALPPSAMEALGSISESGDLLLVKEKNILLILRSNGISGYDISNPKNPQKKWSSDFESRTGVVSARLWSETLYLVTRQWSYQGGPCPIRPLTVNGKGLIIPCTDIWRPVAYLPADTTYTAMMIDSTTGTVSKTVSFVGSSSNSVVYMSPLALYITNYRPENQMTILIRFIPEKARDLYPSSVVERIEKVAGYDLSDYAKSVEIENIIESYLRSLGDDERMRIQNETQNRLSDYLKAHVREFEATTIVKVNLSDFSIAATGKIPGNLLNQFALDEHNGNLRAAVTIAGRASGLGVSESANDVYVLDGSLAIIGSVKDMGTSERIYSARFVGARGYLVTFRETDPFYVLDLSDPRNPKLSGELKIPGYSSYLHPISDGRVLGVGKEGQNVKLSLFDVSDPAHPSEKAKYTLDEYWSEVLNNHRAFLLDDKHSIFFIPGSKGAYVFSFAGDSLSLTKTLSKYQTKRALYLDDYLYIVSDNSITVFDERTWEKAGELTL